MRVGAALRQQAAGGGDMAKWKVTVRGTFPKGRDHTSTRMVDAENAHEAEVKVGSKFSGDIWEVTTVKVEK